MKSNTRAGKQQQSSNGDGPVALLRDAQWIWPDHHGWDLVNCFALFRRVFALPSRPRKARLLITADQSYRLFVNGRFVARGPARGFQHSWPYDEIDVSEWLVQGTNVIAIRAFNPGRGSFQYISQGYAGLLFALRVGRQTLLSDRNWRCIRQRGVARDTVPVSMQMFSQEHVDARLSPHGWTSAVFDDSQWSTPVAVPNGAMPWSSIEPRRIPLLRETGRTDARAVGAARGACRPEFERVRDVAELHFRENPRFERESFAVQPLRYNAGRAADYSSRLLDFGHTVVGNVSLQVTGAKGGEIVDLLYFETVDPRSLVPDVVYPSNCFQAFGSRLVCKAGTTEHTFHHLQGFRFLAVTVRGAKSDLEVAWEIQEAAYPLKRRGSFRSSDATFRSIWNACARTQECCCLDAMMDTPWREQAQWWGDARVQARNIFHLDGDTRLLRRGIAQIAEQALPNGLTYGHAPTVGHGCILPDFTLTWILTLWDFYWQTGSTEAFQTHEPNVARALGYFRERRGSNGLVRYDQRYWLFLDWAELFRDGYPAVLNLWYLLALEHAARLYRLVGRVSEARACQRDADALRASLRALVGEDGLVSDGYDSDGRIAKSHSVHAQALALVADLVPGNPRPAVERCLQALDPSADSDRRNPSAFWITHVLSVLIQKGHERAVLEYIDRRWSPMAAHGTTWEVFNPRRGEESHSHAWSAHPLFHLMETIGGIRQDGPAWKKVVFAPFFFGTHGGAKIPTPQGAVSSRWTRKKSGQIDVSLSLPGGVEASVRLPGIKPLTVTTGGRWTVSTAPVPLNRTRAA